MKGSKQETQIYPAFSWRLPEPTFTQASAGILFDMQEEWRDVVGYEGYYEVSNLGRVRSVDRVNEVGSRLRGKLITPSFRKNKYIQYHLYKNKTCKTFLAHRLVASAFVKNENESIYNEINHIDGNKMNNHFSNLEWSNRLENVRHAIKTGLLVQDGINGNNFKSAILVFRDGKIIDRLVGKNHIKQSGYTPSMVYGYMSGRILRYKNLHFKREIQC